MESVKSRERHTAQVRFFGTHNYSITRYTSYLAFMLLAFLLSFHGLSHTVSAQTDEESDLDISNIQVADVRTGSATITFETTLAALASVSYGVDTEYGTKTLSGDVYELEHEFELDELDSENPTHFFIEVTDVDGNVTVSTDQQFTIGQTITIRDSNGNLIEVPSNLAPFEIVNIEGMLNDTLLVVGWQTTIASLCSVSYGGDDGYDESIENIIGNDDGLYRASVDATEYEAGDEIHYRVICEDDNQRTATSYDHFIKIPVPAIDETLEASEEFVNMVTVWFIPILAILLILSQIYYFIILVGGLAQMILKFDQILDALFSRVRKKRSWGVVYDAETKRPIPFATVKLLDAKDELVIQEKLTDLKGRYSFEVVNGNFRIEADHRDFQMAKGSKILLSERQIIGRYIGGLIELKDGDRLLGYDIPMLNRSKIARTGKVFYQLKDRFRNILRRLKGIFSILTILILVAPLFFATNILYWVLLASQVFIVITFFFVRTFEPKSWGKVMVGSTKRPLQGAFIRVFSTSGNRLENTVMSDENGEYGFYLEPGEYVLIGEYLGYIVDAERIKGGEVTASKVYGPALRFTHSEKHRLQDVPVTRGDSPLMKKSRVQKTAKKQTGADFSPFGN